MIKEFKFPHVIHPFKKVKSFLKIQLALQKLGDNYYTIKLFFDQNHKATSREATYYKSNDQKLKK